MARELVVPWSNAKIITSATSGLCEHSHRAELKVSYRSGTRTSIAISTARALRARFTLKSPGASPGSFSVFPRIVSRPGCNQSRTHDYAVWLLMNMASRLPISLKSKCTRSLFFILLLTAALATAAQAMQATDRVVAWGDLNYDLSFAASSAGIAGVAQLAPGDFHSLLMKSDGSLLAWGDDRFNQTNIPDTLLTSPAAQITAGNIHNLALMRDGSAIAWGPLPGQPGDYGQCSVPAGLGPVRAIAAGAVHNLVLKGDGTVAAWGYNMSGQCSVPPGLSNVVAVAGGMYHSLALQADGSVMAWGDNQHGQTAMPDGLSQVTAIAAGGFHSLALRKDGTVVSWGAYGLAQVEVPPGLTNVVAIATGDYHSLALKADGTLVAWGLNSAGQCSIPAGLTNITAIAARGGHSMVLIQQAPASPPELSITLSGANVVVAWPASVSGLVLQQSSQLNPPNWVPVPSSPLLLNNQNQVALPASDKMFFRLAAP